MKNLFNSYVNKSAEFNWTVFGNLLSFFGLIYLSSRLTFYFSPKEFGLLSLLLTFQGLLTQISFGALNNGVSRYYRIAIEDNEYINFIKDCFRLFFKVVVVIFIITSIIVILLQSIGISWSRLFILTIIVSIITGFSSLVTTIQNSARQRAIVAYHAILDPWLKLLFIYLLFFKFPVNLDALLYVYVLVSSIILVSQLYFLRKKAPNNKVNSIQYIITSDSWSKKIFKFSIPIIIGGVFNWGFNSSQRWALNNFSSIDNVGMFSVLSQFTYTPIVLIGGVFLSFITPIVYDKVGNMKDIELITKTELFIYRTALLIIFISILLAGLSFFFGENIFKYFVSKEYFSISCYIPQMVLSAGLLQASSVISLIISIHNKTKFLLFISILVNSLVIICNFLFTWLFGLKGLVYSMIFGSILHVSFMYILTRLIKPNFY